MKRPVRAFFSTSPLHQAGKLSAQVWFLINLVLLMSVLELRKIFRA